MSHVEGEMVAMFDADHHPDRHTFRRAWQWLSNGYGVVQGHCVVRNGAASRTARTVAVEFEAIYAVSHPGRARLHGFGIFGGSNGYWRADLLRETRMQGHMLTEDIDSALRVVERGFKIASDRTITSRELATSTMTALWHQRMRWAQGWFQVAMKHWSAMIKPSSALTARQRLGYWHLLVWREIYPWLTLQMFPIIAFWVIQGRALDWKVPIFVMTTVFTLSVGPVSTFFAWRLGDPEVKNHKSWYVWFFVVASLLYTEYKNTIARVAQIKQFMGDKQWVVTPREAGGGSAGPPDIGVS
jgi:cellulose synthase/poly-beta-1,6-N-acetylglucosamine synthase-like glycosyltransferase